MQMGNEDLINAHPFNAQLIKPHLSALTTVDEIQFVMYA